MRLRFILIFLLAVLLLMVGAVRYATAPTRTESPMVNSTTSEESLAIRVSPGRLLPTEIPHSDLLTNSAAVTNLFHRFEETPKLTVEQLEPFVNKHHRGVDALLGALRAANDDTYLKEAKERFPDDPRVQFAAAYKSESPDERQRWLEKLKQSAPENSLPNYLLAGERFKEGKIEEAMQEMAAAAGKRGFGDYVVDFMQNAEEAYRSGGYSDAEAKVIGDSSALLPELTPLKQTGRELADLAKRYQAAGDTESAQAVLQMGINLGQRLEDSSQVTLIHNLVGIAIQRLAFGAMDPAGAYGDGGQTVQNQIDTLTARRVEYKELVGQSQPILANMSDSEAAQYYDRLKLYGEVATLRWVINQAPPKGP